MKKLLGVFATLFASPVQAQPTLAEVLTALDAQLAQKRPDYAALLRPPLSAGDIANLEVKYAVTLPDDVKTFYMWHDGQDPQSSAALANNMLILPLAEALDGKEELDGMIGYDFTLKDWWHPGWLPLFHNGGGDNLVVDTAGVHTGKPGQILSFYHDWDLRPIDAPDLLAYMQAVLSYYENTPVDQIVEPYELDGHLPETGLSFTAAGEAVPLK